MSVIIDRKRRPKRERDSDQPSHARVAGRAAAARSPVAPWDDVKQEWVRQYDQLKARTDDVIRGEICEALERLHMCDGKRWMRCKAVALRRRVDSLQAEISAGDERLHEFQRQMTHALRVLRPPRRAPVGTELCPECGVAMRVIANDSLRGCPQCGVSRALPPAAMTSSAEVDNSAASSQKSRLIEWLEFSQGKEYTEPAADVLDRVMHYMVDNKLTGLEAYGPLIATERGQNGPFIDVEDAERRLVGIPDLRARLLAIRAEGVRAAMQAIASATKDDRMRKYYERAPKHAAFISGYWPPRFTNAQEELVRRLFTIASPAYDKYRKPTQPNWPGGYAYFLRCLCVLLGWDAFVEHFPLPSGARNLTEREAMRKVIWDALDWEFIPCD